MSLIIMQEKQASTEQVTDLPLTCFEHYVIFFQCRLSEIMKGSTGQEGLTRSLSLISN